MDHFEHNNQLGSDTSSEQDNKPDLSVHDDVEIAQEVGISPPGYSMRTERTRNDRDSDDFKETKGPRTPTLAKLGIASILISILSFFIIPFILAPIGIVLGVLALRYDDRLGWYGIGIGAVVLVLTTLILPMMIYS
ncbi:DUF4190 domain-containing protein [Thermoactinomyces sp. DSM 45892]|uniref:DUF4190 domain-containing protein n=1 Tax=Thermoactinomyces sp. DSM 45892 TaxID=1882753 RepID=UPI00089B5645|nr:DUF4190 domain-containing protein [Thermoactinomyces sp. DSM 45892]SDY68307.1 hypothetical protein SAMN05444416_10763 [Thermoactinomyces sp. DSM 45892]